MLKKLFGPSTLVAAAFIGPGTLTTCSMAGVQTGYGLLWALLFSIVATIILQEMAARLGFVTRSGLGEAISARFSSGVNRVIVFSLIVSAIVIGNAAYEAGNISGAVLGAQLMAGDIQFLPLLVGLVAFVLLYAGKYKFIESILIGLVILMSICFLVTAILVQPDLGEILKGFVPSPHSYSEFLLILGLIGTTVVPYNLFLHASTISKKWTAEHDLKDIRTENAVSILLGGIISILIVITAAANYGVISEIKSAQDLAIQMEPLFGKSAKLLMGIGLLAAGLSSTLTAPIAASYAAKGLFGWNEDDVKFKLTWITILLIGVLVATTGLKPIMIIKFAQVTNALLLPFIAIYLIYLCNKKEVLGKYTNSLLTNILAGMVMFVTILLSLKTINQLFNLF